MILYPFPFLRKPKGLISMVRCGGVYFLEFGKQTALLSKVGTAAPPMKYKPKILLLPNFLYCC